MDVDFGVIWAAEFVNEFDSVTPKLTHIAIYLSSPLNFDVTAGGG